MVVDFDDVSVLFDFDKDFEKQDGKKKYLKTQIKFGKFIVGNFEDQTYLSSFVEGLRRVLDMPIISVEMSNESYGKAVNLLSKYSVSGKYIVGLGETYDDYSIRAGLVGGFAVFLLKSHSSNFLSPTSPPSGVWLVGVIPFASVKKEFQRVIELTGR